MPPLGTGAQRGVVSHTRQGRADAMRLGRVLLVTVVLLALVVGGAWRAARQWYAAPGPLTEATTVVIAPGTGVQGIARVLAQAGVIRQPLLYRALALAAQPSAVLQAGEYAFPAGIAPQAVTATLTQGAVVIHRITIPEGLATDDILALLRQERRLTGELPGPIAEGTLLPATYFFRRGDTRAQVLARMQTHMQAVVEAAWQARKPGVPLRTPQEAVTLASIVEKETGLPEERGRVAAVFLNRLRRGMKLQADPTTLYAITRTRGVRPQGLSRDDLALASPYNTYVMSGLPPGPIAHPGPAALEAVLNPPETAELYFVATGTGGHVFAATLDEHTRNVAQYRHPGPRRP
jgi:UPF0755 protein